ncbi:hypothetical protein ACQP2E_24960 [Actinoplanes sp. CA-015351]|uniref:hypothetical protein n=1 Tax=Actinoplanes sp. CA-015351 TaxID=3239897 RepID=UPI003D986EDF
MSLLQELGAQLRATSDELPSGLITAAMERLRTATEILNWVREQSVDDLGVPVLGNATEHAERAAAAVRVAQDAIESYLAAVGLAGTPGAAPGQEWRAALKHDESRQEPKSAGAEKPESLGPWWQARVAELTGEPVPDKQEPANTGSSELLRRVAAGVRAGDRARLGRELHAVSASTGLGLAALTPPVLHRLAGDLLGHDPRPEDVPRLRSAAEARVRALLPGTSPAVLETLISRICRAPMKEQQQSQQPDHPADNAVTASVLTGVLLARLGRDAGSLNPDAPEPVRQRADSQEDRS